MQSPLILHYSWIALTASAPIILLLTCWTLAVFYNRRNHWTTMDVFLVAILSQSIFQQFLGFIYSTLVLLKLSNPLTGEAVCTGMMWFFIAIPIFKGTTITSLAVDRWLFYTRFSYRLNIRKSHVRYHIVVLAILSCMVGFTALITFNNPELLVTLSSPLASSPSLSLLQQYPPPPQYSFDQCTFLPFKFDLKFVIFYLSVHCVVVLTGLTVLAKTLCHKKTRMGCSSNSSSANNGSQLLPHHHHHQLHTKKLHYKRRRSSPPMLDVTPTLSNTSTASSTISNGSPTAFFSTPGLTAKAVLSNSPNHAFLHQQQQQQPQQQSKIDFSQRIRVGDDINFRLSPAMGLVLMTMLCTHLAFTIATILSRMDILVPIASIGYGSGDSLSPTNWPVTNLLLWLQVVEGLIILLILFIVDNVIPMWIFNRAGKDANKASKIPHHHSYVIENSTNDKAETSFNPQTNLNNRSSGGGGNAHYTNQAFTPNFKNNKFPITNGSLFAGLPAASSASTSSGVIRSSSGHPMMMPPDRNHQASNNNNGRFAFDGRLDIHRRSRNDFDSIGAAFQEDESEYDRKSYHNRYASVASVTTNAADDFEFQMPQRPLPIPNKDFNPSTYVVPKSQPLPPLPPPQTQFNLRNSNKSTEKAEKSQLMKQKNRQQHIYEEFESGRQSQKMSSSRSQTMGGGLSNHQPTSLSMNDLDLIDDGPPTNTTNACNNTGTTEPYEHKQRMYRKRGRLHPPHHHHHHNHNHNPIMGRPMNFDRRPQQKPSDQFSDRRVLSMECLSSPSNNNNNSSSSNSKQTEYRNFLDISYLDTGEILVRKADSSKCVFVTDFI